MNSRQAELLAAGRLWAANNAPYLASALFAMSPVMAEGLGTMGIDVHWRLYLDPHVLEIWSTEEVGSVLIHEVHHLIRSHSERAAALGVDESSRHRFNIAADFEINDDLRDLPLPVGGVDPERFGLPSGELVETYYLLLEGLAQLPDSDCGAGAHGIRREWELGRDLEPSVDELEADLIRQQVAIEVRSLAESGHRVPEGLERWAVAFLRPVIDWRRELAALVRSGINAVSGSVDYSYRRPSRRSGSPIGRAVILPALVQPLPCISVVVDTSESMSDDALSRALAEIGGILNSSGVGRTRIKVLACDTAVHSTQSIFSVQQIQLLGGGGTDMSIGIAHAETLRPRPDLIVVVTDGYTPWPEVTPRVRVVVALVGSGPEPPSWAHCVHIPSVDD